ncbi:hypothetical protein PENSPDRAFT_665100 [Peniophora sp. CONT]|nr:hypothetical protein PENSPDRAFT_665100 [Peniophora sp. CONT]
MSVGSDKIKQERGLIWWSQSFQGCRLCGDYESMVPAEIHSMIRVYRSAVKGPSRSSMQQQRYVLWAPRTGPALRPRDDGQVIPVSAYAQQAHSSVSPPKESDTSVQKLEFFHPSLLDMVRDASMECNTVE